MFYKTFMVLCGQQEINKCFLIIKCFYEIGNFKLQESQRRRKQNILEKFFLGVNGKAGLTIRAGWCSFCCAERLFWARDCFQGYQQAEQSRRGPGRGQIMCGLGTEGALESSQDVPKDEKRMAWVSGLPGSWRYFPISLCFSSHFTSITLRGYA